jgi:hypothetical protein
MTECERFETLMYIHVHGDGACGTGLMAEIRRVREGGALVKQPRQSLQVIKEVL